ncbi:MAG: hypothetical protein K6B75_08405 [Lachnospiraceae bacterium]|nr:hypothetical protein [Lachnospiraceae bacterium]
MKNKTNEQIGIDPQTFLENWHPYYHACDEIAWIDDIDKLLDGEAVEGDAASTGNYAGLSHDELISEKNKLMGKVMREAFNHYMKVNYPYGRMESFVITRVTRDDLDALGFDAQDLDDSTMGWLASRMENDYLEQLYWTSLKITAEYMDIPLKGEPEEEEEE